MFVVMFNCYEKNFTKLILQLKIAHLALLGLGEDKKHASRVARELKTIPVVTAKNFSAFIETMLIVLFQRIN